MREGGEERGVTWFAGGWWLVTTVACALVERYVGAWQAGALFVLLVLVLVLVLSRLVR
jgi:hypothetical protein